jgi:hypothetical protein
LRKQLVQIAGLVLIKIESAAGNRGAQKGQETNTAQKCSNKHAVFSLQIFRRSCNNHSIGKFFEKFSGVLKRTADPEVLQAFFISGIGTFAARP